MSTTLQHPLTEEYPDMMHGAYDLEMLARTVYQQRARSPKFPTEEEWENKKVRFPGSVRSCYDDVLEMIESGELDS